MSWAEYRTKFERANVRTLLPGQLEGRTVLVLGKQAWRLLGLPPVQFFDRMMMTTGGGTLILIPHPSGRNLFYNVSKNRYRVTRLLRRLAEREGT
jgi:hypothetical protein